MWIWWMQSDFDSLVANSNITPFDGDTSSYDDPTLAVCRIGSTI
jgi:hypothetical protein